MPKVKGVPFKSEHISCDCGGVYSDKYNYLQHIKTKKHQYFVETGNIYIAKSYLPDARKEYHHEYYLKKKQKDSNQPILV